MEPTIVPPPSNPTPADYQAVPPVLPTPPLTPVAAVAPIQPLTTPISELDGVVTARDVYAAIASQIVKEQEQIIGALAVEEANQVEGLHIDPGTYQCTIVGDARHVIEGLIDQYRDFFGNAAVQVCKEAAARFMYRLPDGEMPLSLQ